MKKIISLFMAFVMLLSITAGLNLTAYAETATSGKCGENVYWNYDENTKTLTVSGNGAMYDYDLFGTNAPWWNEKDGGFEYLFDIKNININENVIYIGSSSFACSEVNNVNISNTVRTIGCSAFWGCSSLKSVEIPNGVETIGTQAFAGCSITSITIPSSVVKIDCAFNFCEYITNFSVAINNKNYSSKDGVLFNKDMSNLIKYPVGNERTEYVIPKGVKTIGETAFEDSYNLTNIKISDSVITIENQAFGGCSNITEIEIPNSVNSIGDGAFANCMLTTIVIPNSVKYIGKGSFNCDSLINITVDSDNSYYIIKDNVLFDKQITRLVQYPGGKTDTTYTIPNTVKIIEGEGISNGYLNTLIIPSSISQQELNDEFYISNLKEINYAGSKEEWENLNIAFFSDFEITYNFDYINNTNTNPTPGGGSTGGGGGFTPAPTPNDTDKKDNDKKPETEPAQPTAPTDTTEKPASVKVNKALAKKKALVVYWNKIADVSGYQIQVATDKKFKKNKKTVTVAKQNASKKTVKKLKAKKKYFVRVRAYKIVDGEKSYGKWSKIKTVKTK